MKTINIDFTDSTVGNVGRAGEHNNTKIISALSPELAKCDFLTAEVGTATGEKIPVEGTYNEENSTFSIILTNQLTVEGALSLQLVGYVTEAETAEPQIITKSPIVSGFITQSINGVEASADSNPNLLARIWAKIREWADKIHTHDNYWSLSDLYCEASEVEQGGNNPFPILPDYVGVDRPTFRGNHLRYSSDGGVIRKVEEKGDGDSKFLRLWFEKGVIDTLFDVPDFIDIPVKLVNEKVEEIAGPEIVNNSLGLELELGFTGGNSASGDYITRDEWIEESANIDNRISFNTMLAESALKALTKISQDAYTLDPNRYYDFGTAQTLTLDFGVIEELAVYRNEYAFTFISGATPTVLTLPDTVKWANELTIEANKKYEISIVDNIGLWCAVEVSE